MNRRWWLFALIAVPILWGVTRWSPDVEAYQTYTASKNEPDSNCALCHGGFNSGAAYQSRTDGQIWANDLMTVHSTTMLSGDCDTCHASGRNPVFLNMSNGGDGFDPISCTGCHGRPADRSLNNSRCVEPANQVGPCGDGAGLRQHHYNADRTINTPIGPLSTRVCATCHADANPANFQTAGEDSPPSYYFTPDNFHPGKPTDPCNPPPDFPENIDGGPDGLNNDGDFDALGPLYDQFDPDCETVDPCAGVVCDDGNVCTNDACDPATGECVFTNNNDPCDDGSFCTIGDRCNFGLCLPSGARDCNDGQFCTGSESCDEINDLCVSSGNPCNPATQTCNETTDTCDALDPCAGVVCDDGNACTADACDPATGACVFVPIPPPGPVGPLSHQDVSTFVWAPTADAVQWNSYRGTIPAPLLGSRLPASAYDHVCLESADAAGDGATTSSDPDIPPVGTAFYYDVTGEHACAEGPLGVDSAGAVRPNAAPCPTPP